MVTFNNTLDVCLQSVNQWSQKAQLNNVTFIRDVYGKISLLLDNKTPIQDAEEGELRHILEQKLGVFFGGHIYWKNTSRRNSKTEKRTKLIADIIDPEHVKMTTIDGIDIFVAERPIAKKAWIKNNNPDDELWTYEDAVENGEPKVVTFYSFKGGMGRTTALAAVALNLIRQGKNVIMVDTDIEAPGLATLFFDEELIDRGVLDYLIEHNLMATVNIRDYVLDVTDAALLDEQDGNLYLMPAGKVDGSYLQKLARIDYQDNRENHLRDSVAAMLKDIRAQYPVDYILIDARAGFHDLGGIVTTQLPHGTVLFGNQSRQSWDGICQVLCTIGRGHSEDYPLMIVDSMCEKFTSPNFSAAKNAFTEKAYTICVENYYEAGSVIPGLDAKGEAHSPEFIPFDDNLLQGFELYSNGNQEQNERVKAYRACLTNDGYRKITERIKGWFGEDGNEG